MGVWGSLSLLAAIATTIWTYGQQMGAQVPLTVNVAGNYVLSVAAFDVNGLPATGCGAA